MLPKVTLKAPPGVGGQIHASNSLNNYSIDEDGEVVVDSVDVQALLGAGYYVKPHDATPMTETTPVTSPSPSADIEGAHALDPAAREAGHRQPEPEDTKPGNSQDHGLAQPPHTLVDATATDSIDAKHVDAAAELEAQQRELTGGDPAQPRSITHP